MLRAGLAALIRSQSRLSQIVEATGDTAGAAALQCRPEVVVIDVDELFFEPSTIYACIHSLSRMESSRGVVVIAAVADQERRIGWHRAGAHAIVCKDQTPDYLHRAVHNVRAGTLCIDRELLRVLLGDPATQPTDMRSKTGVTALTKRELQVLNTVARGWRNKRVAHELGISEVTVRHHLTSIFSKLQVADRFELMHFAHERRLGADTPVRLELPQFEQDPVPLEI